MVFEDDLVLEADDAGRFAQRAAAARALQTATEAAVRLGARLESVSEQVAALPSEDLMQSHPTNEPSLMQSHPTNDSRWPRCRRRRS